MSRVDGGEHTHALTAIHTRDESEWDSPVHEHLAACVECRETAEALHLLRSRVRDRASAHVPADLVASVRSRLAEQAGATRDPERGSAVNEARSDRDVRARRPSPSRHRPALLARTQVLVPLAMAAGLVLGIWIDRPSEPEIVNGEVRRSMGDLLGDVTHDRHLLERTGRPFELESSDPRWASAWLSDGLGFPVTLARGPEGWSLEGVRVWHTVSRLSAMASYVSPSARITVFAVPRSALVDAGAASVATELGPIFVASDWDFEGAAWFEGELAWAAVGNLERERLVDWVIEYRRGLSVD